MANAKEMIEMLCRNGEGLTQARLAEELQARGISQAEMVPALNTLLAAHDISTFERASASAPGGTELVFRIVDDAERDKLRGLSNDDMSVLQAIRASRDRGIWSRELRFRTGLQSTAIARALRLLEGRRVIKSVRAVGHKSHKLYMLADVEPAREVTGGAWYSDAELDEEFVSVLQEQVFFFVKCNGCVDVQQVHEYVRNTGVFKAELRDEDVAMVLSVLVFDGRLEEVLDARSKRVLWKPSKLAVPRNALCGVPCAECPVADVCCVAEGSVVNPRDCPYFSDWLDAASTATTASTATAPPPPVAP